MDWLERLNSSVSYIEDHLLDKVDYNEAAKIACCSVYNFQRMFSFIADVPISEYIRRRKMTLAAFELQNSTEKIVDIALKYGYESPEAFARAFQAMQGITPTLARSKGVKLKAYPRITFQIIIKGDIEMNYRIEEKEPFEVFGIEGVFSTKNDENLIKIPEFWTEMFGNGEIEKLEYASGTCSINAICGYESAGKDSFPYMICAAKNPNSQTKGYKTVKVPAATWAIFTSDEYDQADVTKALQNLNKRVFTEWLPTSKYERLDGYDIEKYYIKENGKGYCEIWIRVAAK